ncbi:MAG: ABC transporter permease [Candidatus Limnocylindrales bacterium]
MDLQPLFDIPIAGIFFQLIDYMIRVLTLNGAVILALAAPIALGSYCGFMNERSGVVNIGIEGMMIASAFAGWFVASAVVQFFPDQPRAEFFFGASPALLLGLLAAIVTGMVVSAVHAWLSITVKADQIISGVVINIVMLGVTGYLIIIISRTAPLSAGKFTPYTPPEFLTDLPFVGWVFNMFLNHGPITMSVIVLAIVLQVLLFRSRWGLRTRSVGEHPKAAETVGIDVIRLRYRNVILGGIFAGLAGAWFTLDFGNSFQAGMTAGRGFIALAALIFGRWMPLGAFGAALLFASASSLSVALRTIPPTGELGDILTALPNQFWAALPYLVTIIVLAGAVGRSVAPAAVGKPYERESAS